MWFRFEDEIVLSSTLKQLVDVSGNRKKKKIKEKREKNGFDLGSPGSYYGKKKKTNNLIT